MCVINPVTATLPPVKVDSVAQHLCRLRAIRPSASAAQLRGLKAVTLKGVNNTMRHHGRRWQALGLIKQFFPDEFQEAYPGPMSLTRTDWIQIMSDFLHYVEFSDWFLIDWEAVNDAYQICMEDASYPNSFDELAGFLTYIPVQYHGFTLGQVIYDYPFMALLHVLLANPADCSTLGCQVDRDVLAQLQKYDPKVVFEDWVIDKIQNWGTRDRESAWLRLLHIEDDPDTYPEPVQWLPLAARWVTHATGNALIDFEFDWWRDVCQQRWDDLDRVRQWSVDVIEYTQLRERLMEWYLEGSPNNLNTLAKFIMNGQCVYELNW